MHCLGSGATPSCSVATRSSPAPRDPLWPAAVARATSLATNSTWINGSKSSPLITRRLHPLQALARTPTPTPAPAQGAAAARGPAPAAAAPQPSHPVQSSMPPPTPGFRRLGTLSPTASRAPRAWVPSHRPLPPRPALTHHSSLSPTPTRPASAPAAAHPTRAPACSTSGTAGGGPGSTSGTAGGGPGSRIGRGRSGACGGRSCCPGGRQSLPCAATRQQQQHLSPECHPTGRGHSSVAANAALGANASGGAGAGATSGGNGGTGRDGASGPPGLSGAEQGPRQKRPSGRRPPSPRAPAGTDAPLNEEDGKPGGLYGSAAGKGASGAGGDGNSPGSAGDDASAVAASVASAEGSGGGQAVADGDRQRQRATRKQPKTKRRPGSQGAGAQAATSDGSSAADGEGEGAADWDGGDGGRSRAPGGSPAHPSLGGRRRRPPDLLARIRSCRTLEQLVALYDTVQQEATELAASRAGGAGAAAAAAGLAAGPGGAASALPAPVVWMFLAAASDLVAAWRGRVQAGQRARRLKQARQEQKQLQLLVDRACGVVLWAERLPPAKVCLLLTLLVAAERSQRVGAEQHLKLLAEDSLNALDDYMSGQMALAASSFAKLDFFPGKGWVEVMVEASTGHLHRWRPGDLAFMSWALAKWKTAPPVPWLEELYAALEACGPRVTEADLSLVCWALGAGLSGAHWAARPPDSLTNFLMMEAQVRLPSLGGQALAHVAWGLCVSEVRPPGFWLREFFGAAKAALPFATSGLQFSNLLWAAAAWQRERHPGEGWLQEACKQSARWLPSLDSRGLAVLLLALSDLEHTPPPQWVGLAVETAHRQLPYTEPASAVAVLWAVSRFERQRAAAAAVLALNDATAPQPPRRRRLAGTTPEDLLAMMQDLAVHLPSGGQGGAVPPELRPPRQWLVRYAPLLQDFALAAAGALPVASAQRWGGPAGPHGRRTIRTLRAPPYSFPGLDANQMLDLAVALADLYVYPGDDWMRGHEAKMAALGVVAPAAAATAAAPSLGPSWAAAAGDTGDRAGFGGGAATVDRGYAAFGAAGGGHQFSPLTRFQRQLLASAYAALDDTWDGYAAPRGGEQY